MDDARLRLAFSGLHPGRVAKMVSTRGSASRALRSIERGGGDVSDLARDAVAVPAAERRAELDASGMSVVYLGGAGYPEHLARWEDAPDVLFVRGDVPLEPGVAVVGTRKCTAYGREVATRYGTAIADAGWTLVSGLARGIDGAAHRGTVATGGVGVAVLGCGLDVAYLGMST
jgi:DNA processing protein